MSRWLVGLLLTSLFCRASLPSCLYAPNTYAWEQLPSFALSCSTFTSHISQSASFACAFVFSHSHTTFSHTLLKHTYVLWCAHPSSDLSVSPPLCSLHLYSLLLPSSVCVYYSFLRMSTNQNSRTTFVSQLSFLSLSFPTTLCGSCIPHHHLFIMTNISGALITTKVLLPVLLHSTVLGIAKKNIREVFGHDMTFHETDENRQLEKGEVVEVQC